MGKKAQKKISNRFDHYEICHAFTESTQQYLQKLGEPLHSKFLLRCLLGTLLGVNAYLSHWGPWKWPSNYYLILFSVIFYYVGSTIYTKLSPINCEEGNLIGEYKFKGKRRIFVMAISDSKRQYTLEIYDSESKQCLQKKAFIYTEYFTERGILLEDLYHRHLTGFLKTLDP